jgi:hypothetical protein
MAEEKKRPAWADKPPHEEPLESIEEVENVKNPHEPDAKELAEIQERGRARMEAAKAAAAQQPAGEVQPDPKN